MDTIVSRAFDPLDAIRFRRTKLPAHECPGADRRRWALSVCSAEVDHAVTEFWSLNAKHGTWDRYTTPAAPQLAMWPHEKAAARVLNHLSHLQAEEQHLRDYLRRMPRERRYVRERVRTRLIPLKRGFNAAVSDYFNARGIAQ
jgi:hypothetical protein